jgi:uncharacterized protein
MFTAQALITTLDLRPHPEGGWFAEVFRSPDQLPPSALPERYLGSRAYVSSILFLLNEQELSRFHRLQSDELWHFYEGVPLRLHLLHPDGTYTTETLGRDFSRGERCVIPVRRHVWMAAELVTPNGYALAGCTVAPGFAFTDFQLALRRDLLDAYPDQSGIIERLTTP